MVEALESTSKRQKTDKYDPMSGLTNVNYCEEILN